MAIKTMRQMSHKERVAHLQRHVDYLSSVQPSDVLMTVTIVVCDGMAYMGCNCDTDAEHLLDALQFVTTRLKREIESGKREGLMGDFEDDEK